MSTAVNSGREFRIWNFSVGTSGSEIVLNQRVNSVTIKCRTNVDLELREGGGAGDYFTIPGGTSLELDSLPQQLSSVFYLTSTSGTVNVEIIGSIE